MKAIIFILLAYIIVPGVLLITFCAGFNIGTSIEVRDCKTAIKFQNGLHDDLNKGRAFIVGKHRLYPIKEPKHTYYYKKNGRK